MPSRNILQERKETMGSKKNVDMSSTEDKIKIVAQEDVQNSDVSENSEATQAESDITATKKAVVKSATPSRIRSKKYVSTRSQVDKTRKYSISEALKTIKKLSYTKFDGTLTIDGVVKEVGKVATLTLPHATGKTVRVAIVDDAVLAEIEAGNINFDVLVTAPQYMPKLAKFARVLGPKGLMPNPKNGTVTPKPELKKAELEKGAIDIKTEKKTPVIHVSIGKVSMDDAALAENIEAIMTAAKGKLVSASLSATMSPSVKLEIVK